MRKRDMRAGGVHARCEWGMLRRERVSEGRGCVSVWLGRWFERAGMSRQTWEEEWMCGEGGMRARRLWVLYGVRAWRDDTSCGYCCGISMSGERWSGSQVGEGWECA
uniref:Uncharacterized protein n=1 Tax=Bartonella schoenbuchensis TaxID=165694 RepID=A0A024LQF5_9HYPH|nr:hypothetical protein BN1046_00337 [Bartonella schoenbuchensis]